jgi:hypothetical protein
VSSDSSISGPELDEIVEHDLGGRDLASLAVAHDTRSRRVEHREAVERPLGAPFLHDPDERVRHEHDTEQRVLERAHRENDDEHRSEDGVEPREDVRAQDLLEGSARALDGGVREALVDPLSHRDRIEALRRGHRPGSFELDRLHHCTDGSAGAVAAVPPHGAPLTSPSDGR